MKNDNQKRFEIIAKELRAIIESDDIELFPMPKNRDNIDDEQIELAKAIYAHIKNALLKRFEENGEVEETKSFLTGGMAHIIHASLQARDENGELMIDVAGRQVEAERAK